MKGCILKCIRVFCFLFFLVKRDHVMRIKSAFTFTSRWQTAATGSPHFLFCSLDKDKKELELHLPPFWPPSQIHACIKQLTVTHIFEIKSRFQLLL